MNKTLKFKSQFVGPILKGDKVSTVRLFDDKNLSVGDVLDFIDSESGSKFTEAKIINIKETIFASIVKGTDNIDGTFEHYKEYYKRDIKPEDQVKIIYFSIIFL